MDNQTDPSLDALKRLSMIYGQWKQYPGRAPGGTGATGLLQNDAQGWSDMLNQQTEATNIENQLQGKSPLEVRANYHGGLGVPESNPSLANDPSWWLSASQTTRPTSNVAPGSVWRNAPQDQATTALNRLATLYRPNPPISTPNAMVQ